MRTDRRVCRYCKKTPDQARFYDHDTKVGVSAGHCCQPCWVAKSIEWRRKNKLRVQERVHFARALKLGLTREQYDAIYKDASCRGCLVKKNRGGFRLSLDHDHETGRVRGTLCHPCNKVLGMVGDRPEVLRRLAAYLESGTFLVQLEADR